MRWIQWIIDNPQVLFIIGGAIAFWLNERRKVKEGREMAEEAEREPGDEEMEERTRRIQEEIRRKIAERQGDAPLPDQAPYEMERPVPPPLLRVPPTLRPAGGDETGVSGAEELERVMNQQRRYAEELERLQEAERARQEAQAASAGAALSMAVYDTTPAAAASSSAARAGGGVRADLRDRAALRRAIVLREVLGAPKALQ